MSQQLPSPALAPCQVSSGLFPVVLSCLCVDLCRNFPLVSDKVQQLIACVTKEFEEFKSIEPPAVGMCFVREARGLPTHAFEAVGFRE